MQILADMNEITAENMLHIQELTSDRVRGVSSFEVEHRGKKP
jgi:hypothetical protein